jgi:hypothetical protein
MRGLSLHQPYASLLACGIKKTETRSRPMPYRGPVAIQASKVWTPVEADAWARFSSRFGDRFPALTVLPPLGAVVAVAELVDIFMFGSDPRRHEVMDRDPTGTIVGRRVVEVDEDDLACGDFTCGRWGWQLENVRALATPIELRGRQGLWGLDEDEERAVRAAVRS